VPIVELGFRMPAADRNYDEISVDEEAAKGL